MGNLLTLFNCTRLAFNGARGVFLFVSFFLKLRDSFLKGSYFLLQKTLEKRAQQFISTSVVLSEENNIINSTLLRKFPFYKKNSDPQVSLASENRKASVSPRTLRRLNKKLIIDSYISLLNTERHIKCSL